MMATAARIGSESAQPHGRQFEPWEVHKRIVGDLVGAKVHEVLGVSERRFWEGTPWPKPGDELLVIPVGGKAKIEALANSLGIVVYESAVQHLVALHWQVKRGPRWVGRVGFDSSTTRTVDCQTHARMGGFEALALPGAVRADIVDLPEDAQRIYFLGTAQGSRALALERRQGFDNGRFILRLCDFSRREGYYIARSDPRAGYGFL